MESFVVKIPVCVTLGGEGRPSFLASFWLVFWDCTLRLRSKARSSRSIAEVEHFFYLSGSVVSCPQMDQGKGDRDACWREEDVLAFFCFVEFMIEIKAKFSNWSRNGAHCEASS